MGYSLALSTGDNRILKNLTLVNMAAEHGVRALDLAYCRALRDFPDDEGGHAWHPRLLVFDTQMPGVWVTVKPDIKLLRLENGQFRVMTLGRDALFPASKNGEIYRFDASLSDDEIRLFVYETRELLDSLGCPPGTSDASPSPVRRWIIADPASDMLGNQLPEGISGDPDDFAAFHDDGVELYSVALVRVNGDWVLALLASILDFGGWRRHMISFRDQDVPALCDRRSPDRSLRTLTFAGAMMLAEGTELPDTFLPGARAAPELLRVVSQREVGLIAHHLDFIHKGRPEWRPPPHAHDAHDRVETMDVRAIADNVAAHLALQHDSFAAGVRWHQEQLQSRCPPCPTSTRPARLPEKPTGTGKDEGTDRRAMATAGAQAGGHDA